MLDELGIMELLEISAQVSEEIKQRNQAEFYRFKEECNQESIKRFGRPLFISDGRNNVKPKYKYQDKTWCGRGSVPKWMLELEANGHSREEFLIQPTLELESETDKSEEQKQ